VSTGRGGPRQRRFRRVRSIRAACAVDETLVLSWVFRHRSRLIAIYGSVRPEAIRAALPAGRVPAIGLGDRPDPDEDAPSLPGRVVRRRHWTLVVPMPPPWSPLATEELSDEDLWLEG